MRFFRVHISRHKTVIYHPSLSDIVSRILCLLGRHEYETVLEYASVGAREEMCVHCLKERYSLHPPKTEHLHKVG